MPILHDIREKVEEFYRGDLQSESLEHYVVKCFEGASSTFTKHLLDAVHARRDFQEWYAAALRQRLSDTVPTGEDDHPPEELPAQKKGGAKEDFRQQAAKIRTEAYQIEVDNMSNWHAEVEVGKIRRKTLSLAEQCLSGPTFRGYEVAIHRGLLHMVIDYQDFLSHAHKYKDICIDIYCCVFLYMNFNNGKISSHQISCMYIYACIYILMLAKVNSHLPCQCISVHEHVLPTALFQRSFA